MIAEAGPVFLSIINNITWTFRFIIVNICLFSLLCANVIQMENVDIDRAAMNLFEKEGTTAVFD